MAEDSGFYIDTLKGFPGIYTKYIVSTIVVEGILRLLSGENNRVANFLSFTIYIDNEGNIHQFNRDIIE